MTKSHKWACLSYQPLLAQKAEVCATKLSDSYIAGVHCVVYRTIFLFLFLKEFISHSFLSLCPTQNTENEWKYCRGGGKLLMFKAEESKMLH